MRRLAGVGVATLCAVAVAGCVDDGPLARDRSGGVVAGITPGVVEVTLVAQDISFDIDEITLEVDEELGITFDNRDENVRHSVHVEGHGIDTGTEILPGPNVQTLRVEFSEPGEYEYFCDTHPREMFGTIIVEP